MASKTFYFNIASPRSFYGGHMYETDDFLVPKGTITDISGKLTWQGYSQGSGVISSGAYFWYDFGQDISSGYAGSAWIESNNELIVEFDTGKETLISKLNELSGKTVCFGIESYANSGSPNGDTPFEDVEINQVKVTGSFTITYDPPSANVKKILIGSQQPTKIFLGTTEIRKIYQGNKLVWLKSVSFEFASGFRDVQAMIRKKGTNEVIVDCYMGKINSEVIVMPGDVVINTDPNGVRLNNVYISYGQEFRIPETSNIIISN